MAFPKNSSDIFATLGSEGVINVWDNNTMSIITKCSSQTANRVPAISVCFGEDGSVVTGWKDGFVRAFAIDGSKQYSPCLWEIANAHKGGVLSIYVVYWVNVRKRMRIIF